MRKSRYTRDKACQTILDILKPCDILQGQTAKQRIAIIQTTDMSYERKHQTQCKSRRLAKQDLMTEFT